MFLEKIMDLEGTGLLVACQNGSYECVQILLEQPKVEIEAKQKGLYTPLLFAAKYGHEQIVEELLKKKADIEKCQAEGLTAIMLASEALGGNRKMEDVFVKILNLLIEQKENLVHKKSKRKSKALMHAAMYGNEKCLKILLNIIDKDGILADTNVDEDKDDEGDNALSMSVYYGHLSCVKLLLERFWADKELKPESSKKYYEYLSKSESNDLSYNNEGKTALMLASDNKRGQNERGEVLKYLLLEKRADLEVRYQKLIKFMTILVLTQMITLTLILILILIIETNTI